MQQAKSMRLGVLASLLAVLALAFALFAGTTPAEADDNLVAGDNALTTQDSQPGDADYVENEGTSYGAATADTDIVLKLYRQASGSKDTVLIKEYTKAEIDTLAAKSTTDPVAVVYGGKQGFNVGVSTVYVTLDDLLANAGASKFWREGSAIDVGNAKYGTYAYEDYSDAYFYPKTTASEKDVDGAVSVPSMILAVSEATGSIDEDKTAADMIEGLSASDVQSTAAALRVYVGATKDNYTSGEKIAGNRLWSNITTLTVVYDPDATDAMYRLYNPNSGEHFYTASATERDAVIAAGWNDEGTGWTAPIASTTPVYRVYNPNAGDHHYTTSATERDYLVSVGWNDEGIGWYSDDAKTAPLYRQYNPNAVAGAHNFTTSTTERDYLISVGWNDEGIGWYGV